MQKKTWGLVFLAVILGLWYYGLGGATTLEEFLPAGYASSFIRLFFMIVGLMILYEIGSLIFRSVMIKAGAKEGEIKMILGVLQFAFIFVAAIVIMAEWFSLGTLGTIFAAFGGMFLGWSLQAPISGLAAWFLVSILRPFSVGDRVQLPFWGLVGDVVGLSPMYTTLNQVGGSVGSEEPANRTILIPNSMLFGMLVINYTPKGQEKLIEQFRRKFEEQKVSSESSYMLDEFVLRMTFDSDWDEAEKILLEAAREVTADIIKATGQEPYVRADISDWYGVFMRLRFMTLATERPKMMYELTKRIYRKIQSSEKVDIAIPYIYSYKKHFPLGPIRKLERDFEPGS